MKILNLRAWSQGFRVQSYCSRRLGEEIRFFEMIEIPKHPFFMATNFHPEFNSRPNHAHPLFGGVIEAAVQRSQRLYKLESERTQRALPEMGAVEIEPMK